MYLIQYEKYHNHLVINGQFEHFTYLSLKHLPQVCLGHGNWDIDDRQISQGSFNNEMYMYLIVSQLN